MGILRALGNFFYSKTVITSSFHTWPQWLVGLSGYSDVGRTHQESHTIVYPATETKSQCLIGIQVLWQEDFSFAELVSGDDDALDMPLDQLLIDGLHLQVDSVLECMPNVLGIEQDWAACLVPRKSQAAVADSESGQRSGCDRGLLSKQRHSWERRFQPC